MKNKTRPLADRLRGQPVQPARNRLVRRSPQPLALEQRFMFDGAAVAEAVDSVGDTSAEAPAGAGKLLQLAVQDSLPAALAGAEAAAEKLVADFLHQPDVLQQLFAVFNGGRSEAGEAWQTRLNSLTRAVDEGQFGVKVQLLDNDTLLGAKGAFAARGTDGDYVIYLNRDWLEAGADSASITRVLTEELGHAIDAYLNGAADTAGDEGEVFARLLAEGVLRLQPVSALNDGGTIRIDGQDIDVEFANFTFVNAYEMVYDLNNNGAVVGSTGETAAEKEQSTHNFVATGLGQVTVNDDTNSNLFSGNDVSAIGINIGGETYYGWISRPIKSGGVVRGFYFWTDSDFTSLAAAQADGNTDGDSDSSDNRGFLLVVDQSWFDSEIAKTSKTVATDIDGNALLHTYSTVGSSSDRVDTALNALVLAANSAPVARADSQTVSEGTTATGNVLSNDSDAEGNPLTVTQFAVNGQLYPAGSTATLANAGTLVIRTDGSYTFTPVAGYNGSLPVATYVVSDGARTSTATLSIVVTPVNSGPVAAGDLATVTEDIPWTGNLLDNDSDADGDRLTVTGYSFTPAGGLLTAGTIGATTLIPGVGSLIIYGDGSYTFSPAADYAGPVPVITYAISDGNGGTASATLALTLLPVADEPVANPDTNTAAIEASGVNNQTAGAGASGNVLNNDVASLGTKVVAGVGTGVASLDVAEGSTSADGTQVVGLYGTLTIGADGSYHYVVDDNNPSVQALRLSGQTLSDTFAYRVGDDGGNSAVTTLTIVIDGRNDNPVARNDYNTAKESTTLASSNFDYTGYGASGDVLANDSDVDGHLETKTIDGLSITGSATIQSYTSPSTLDATLTFRGDSGFTSVSAGQYLYIQDNGNYYLAFDSNNTAISVVSKTLITGTKADYQIKLSGTPAKYSTGTAGSYTTISSLAFFSNKGVGFESAQGQNPPALTENTSGMKTATSASAAIAGSVVTLTPGTYAGTIAIGMEVSGSGITAGTTISDITYTSGQITSITLSKTYAAGVLSGTLNFTRAGTLSTTLAGQYGSLVLNSDGTYTYTPTTDNAALGEGQSGVEAFNYTMRDAQGATSSATLYITVFGAGGRDPVANDNSKSINEGATSVSGNLLTDPTADIYDAGEGSVIGISSSVANDTVASAGVYEVAGRYGTLTVNVDGSYSYAIDNANAAVNALHDGETLSESFQYVLRDAATNTTHVGTAVGNLSITIHGANDLPVAGRLSDGSVDPAYSTGSSRYEITTPEENSIAGQVKAFDADDGLLTYSAGSTLPSHGSVTVNSDGSYTYQPAGNYVGSDLFTVTVSDPHGATTTISVFVTVTPVNDAPLLDLDGNVDGTGYSASFALGGTAVPIADLDAVISDIDDTHIESATILLTNVQAGDVLSVGDLPSGISADTSVAGQVTLSGHASLADYQAAIRAITFSTSGSDRSTRLFDIRINDGELDSNMASASIAIHLPPLEVEGVTVNEASPYAVFKVTGTDGQSVRLQLEATGAGAGSAVLGLDTANAGATVPLQYLNSSGVWVDYPPGSDVAMNGSVLLVRTAIRQDAESEGLETFTLVAIDDAGVQAAGQGGITDDGTGAYFAEDNLTGNPAVPDGMRLDDDRPLTVDTIAVNEGSQGIPNFAVFTVTGFPEQLVRLTLSDGTATSADYGAGLEYWDGSAWKTYVAGSYVTIPVGYTTLLVRTPIIADDAFERIEQFTLTATNTGGIEAEGHALILDDNTGTRYPDSAPVADGNSWLPAAETTSLDDDRMISVTAGASVSETAGHAAFLVTGAASSLTHLSLGNTAADSDRDAGISGFSMEYSTDGGVTWVAYTWNGTTGNRPVMPEDGKLYVRVNIDSEADSEIEGPETFTLTATYATNGARTAFDAMTILDSTSVPLLDAVDDTATVDEDSVLESTVATNDAAGEAPAGYTLVSGPSHGTLTFHADGSYTYTPEANYHGPDSFSYTLTDADGQSDTATVMLTVNPTSPLLGAVDDTATVDEDSVLESTVASNDATGEAPASYTLVSGPSHGSLTFHADGSYTYTPEADYHGPDSFSYTLTDADGQSDTATVTLTVNPTSPLLDAVDDTATVDEDSVLESTVATNDAAGEAPASYMLASGPSHGSLTFNADGSYTYTPEADYHGPDSFSYTLTDADGQSDTATVTLTVNPTSPLLDAVDDTATVDEDGALTDSVAGNDQAGEAPASYMLVSGPSHGTLTFHADGCYTYTPEADYHGPDSFSYTLTDADGQSDTATVTLTVNPTSPLLDAVDDTATVDEDGALTDSVAGNDQAGEAPAGYTLVSGPSHGSLTFNADGSYTYTPEADYHGPDSFSYTLTDADGQSDTATVTITVRPENDPAVISGDDAGRVVEDTVAEVDGKLDILDADAGESAFVAQAVAGDYGTFTLREDGSWTYRLDNASPEVQALDQGQSLVERFEVRSVDGTIRTVVVVIDGQNEPLPPVAPPPVVAPAAPVVVEPVPDGGLPPQQPVAFDSSIGQIVNEDAGIRQVVNQSSYLGDVYTQDTGFRIVVVQASAASLTVFRGLGDQYAEVGSQSSFAVPYDAFAHSDPNEQIALSAKLADGRKLPDWVAFDPQSGKFVVNPPKEFRGELKIKVMARDTQGREVSVSFRFNVGEKRGEGTGRLAFSEQLRIAGRSAASGLAGVTPGGMVALRGQAKAA
ncbi:Ig-like domain-containing protein [Azonexus sp.]|uniref:Ig-like domain-containing protein n=1 Tax=Azonexus sp. TaxID=1872668 RepID=UPI0035B226A8